MKLYSGPLSLFTAKVRIGLAEKGLDYERVEVGWSLARRYEPHHPDVVAANPKRQVPVLVDGEVVVYDSTRILEYLEDAHPTPPLLPRGAAARARCRQLEALADEILFPPVWDLIEEGFYPAPPGGRDATRAQRARSTLAGLHAELERELADGEYLCGAFSVADIACFVMLSTAASLGAGPGEEHMRLGAWLARSGARPAVARDVAAMRAHVQALFAGGTGSASWRGGEPPVYASPVGDA